jgi:hypothetical protein
MPPPPLPPACRHQHYQIQDKVVVDVYARNIPKERVSVSFQPTHLHVVIKDAEGQVGLLPVMLACIDVFSIADRA